MSPSPARRVAPLARVARSAAGVASLVVAVALAVSACGDGGASYGAGVVVGSCRGFVSSGDAVGDPRLALRAAASWRLHGGAFGQSVPIAPPVGTICVVNAHGSGGRRMVTLADGTHLATYVEPADGGPGELLQSAPLPAPAPTPTALVSVGDGTWQLSASVRSASVWVGAPGTTAVRTDVPPGRSVLPVDRLVSDFARAHPGTLPHLLVLAATTTELLASTGGAPYASSTDSVLTVALETTGTSPEDELSTVERLLSSDSAVPLLAQAVATTRAGGQPPQQVTRLLSLVGSATARTVGPVLVVGSEAADGSDRGALDVDVGQRRRGGAELRPVGTATAPTQGWAGDIWLKPVQADDPDPLELLVVGRPPRPTDPALTLAVGGSSRTVWRTGPVAVVEASEVEASSRGAVGRPRLDVEGRTPDGTIVRPLSAGS